MLQLNSGGGWWTQPANGSAGVQTTAPSGYKAPVAATPAPAGSAALTSTLWRPATAGAQTFGIDKTTWPALIAGLLPEGSATAMACKIPCPSGHLDWEYNNPEWEYYLAPGEGGGAYASPFSLGPDGECVITCKNTPTPNANQAYLSGCLATAGNGGTLFAQDYGYFTSRMKWTLGPGFWPAFWMLSTDNNFTYSIELDLENWQNMGGNPHCGIANTTPSVGTFFAMDTTPAAGFVFGFDYRADFITFYANGVQVLKAATPANCVGKHVFPIWNVAVGTNGSWAGTPPAVAGSSMQMHIEEFAAFA